MACPDRLSQWTTEVSTAFAHLSKPQMWGLVLWSAGIALSGVAGITQISASFRLSAGGTGTNGVSALTRVVVFLRGRRVGKSGVSWRCPRVLLPCWHGCYACGKAK